jgi:23S rRNA (cytosine1962-C5)-methyltransferase
MVACVIFEDEHLLVINKPPGMNTHAPAPYAGQGIFEWLRHHEPRWFNLAIIHRLDKETSGVIVFSKSPLANRELLRQFEARAVRKKYLLLTDRKVPGGEVVVKRALVRAGERYVSRPLYPGAQTAETRFRVAPQAPLIPRLIPGAPAGLKLQAVEAEPVTGRTHQIRVHAAERGFPVLGDALYGGSPARRVCLHALQLRLTHPASGQPLTFEAPPDFAKDPASALRKAVIAPEETSAYRLLHGATDGFKGWYVDRFGDWLLSQSEQPLDGFRRSRLEEIARDLSAVGVYHKALSRPPQGGSAEAPSPQFVLGKAAPERFQIQENGLRFEISFGEGYSVGLFLDQRENRRRLLSGGLGGSLSLGSGPVPGEARRLLNTFAYTCGFSVCAAMAGARTTSIDLSRKHLDWGKRNFALNGLDPAAHEFIGGDVLDWLKRFARKRRQFDIVLLDPPTFSRSGASGVFRAEKDYPALIAAGLAVLGSPGLLFASSNAVRWAPESFVRVVEDSVRRAGRVLVRSDYVPQPPDFTISRAEPGYLKTLWMWVR